MPGLLADVNVVGQVEALIAFVTGPAWQEIWTGLDVRLYSFADVGLAIDTPDDVVWQACQDLGLVLLTANRNSEGPDSLGQAIQERGGLSSLPVLTLANADRVLVDRGYREQVAVKLMETLADIESLRGAGRLYLP